MKLKQTRVWGAVATLVLAGAAQAQQGDSTAKFLGADYTFNGFFRLDTAVSTSNEAPKANQFGDPSNGVLIPRAAGNPGDGFRTQTFSDTFARYVPAREPEINYHQLRFESSQSVSWGAWSIQSRLRALYDPGDLGYRDWDNRDYDFISSTEGGASGLYHGTPNFFSYQVEDRKHPLMFERSGRHYMVDFPALFVQWTNGNMTARLGNQSVAWGQLLFFRVMDVANGLDLRRHLFIDRTSEEYADERMSAPGLRFTWQATDKVGLDSFVQQFIPSVLPNPNTPYNVIASQFILHDRYYQDDSNRELNYGIRLKGEFGNYNLQAMATSRLNPLGTITWARSGVNKPLPNTNPLGAGFNGYCEAVLGSPAGQGCGPQLAQLPFEVAPAGLFSAEQWFDYAGYTRLDAYEGFDSVVRDFQPASGLLFAQEIDGDPDRVDNELDTFFIAGEGLRAHIQRKYYREEIYGLGGGYVLSAEPGSLLDQLIINVEATYIPNRPITDPSLAQQLNRVDDAQVGIVLEKYQRFSQNFPATYMVFQYLWQKETDLLGLSLDGYGSENYSQNGIRLDQDVPTKGPGQNPKIAPGINSANYIVMAFIQPTDAYIYEFSTAMLVDVKGGLLIQPGVQWKPRGNLTVNLFYNYLNGNAWGTNPNKNVISFLEFADEVTLRLGYQF